MRPERILVRTIIVAILPALGAVSAAGQEGGVLSPAEPPQIAADYLDAASLDTIGLMSPAAGVLPANLWRHSTIDDLVALIVQQTAALPASLLDAYYLLLLAETPAPETSAGDGALLRARLDSLLTLGAVDQARALLRIVGQDRPMFFSRWRDVALLDGTVARVCNRLLVSPSLSSEFSDHIYCNHVTGNTVRARSLYEIARSLDGVRETEETILGLLFAPPDVGTPVSLTTDGDVLLARILFDATHSTALIPDTAKLAPLRQDKDLPISLRIQSTETLARSRAVPFERVIAVHREARWSRSGAAAKQTQDLLAFNQFMLLGETAQGLAMLETLFPHFRDTGLLHVFADNYAEQLSAADGVNTLAQQVILALGGTWHPLDCDQLATSEQLVCAFIHTAFGIETAMDALLAQTDTRALLAGLAGVIASPALNELAAANRHGEALLTAFTPFNDRNAVTATHLQDAIALLVLYNDTERARNLAVEWLAMERVN